MKAERSDKIRLAAALGITLLFWASAFAAIRSAGREFSPGHMALLRFLTASTALGIYAAVRGIRRPRGRDIGLFLVCGLLGIGAYHTLLNFGEQTVTAGAACLLINTMPIWAAILAMVLLKERLRGIGWVGIAVSFAGITLIAMGQGGGLRFEARALCIVAAALLGAGYVVMHKKFLAQYGALDFTCWAFFAGTLELALVFWPGFFAAVGRASVRARWEVVYLGVFPGALAYLMFAYATRRMKASAVTSYMNFAPVIAMAIAWPYLREVPTGLSIAGGALAIGGVLVVNRWGRVQEGTKSDGGESLEGTDGTVVVMGGPEKVQ